MRPQKRTVLYRDIFANNNLIFEFILMISFKLSDDLYDSCNVRKESKNTGNPKKPP